MQHVKPLNRQTKFTCGNSLKVAKFHWKTTNLATLSTKYKKQVIKGKKE